MASTEYQARLQRALDYIESHLESEISLTNLATEAGYSPGHFIWIFRAAIGQTPIEYVRGRRMTEATRAILSGDDIVDAVYRFRFSAQDAFTRSFRRTIGSPPGQIRQSGGINGKYKLALNLPQNKGGDKMLNYNLDCDALDSFLRIEQLLTEETRELIARIAIGPVKTGSVDPQISEELIQARVVSLEEGIIRIDTAVFMEEDLEKIHGFTGHWGAELAERITALGDGIPEMSPGHRRLLIGMNGIDQGMFELLISEGYAFNHRETDGRYATAKIDFFELCDAYDQFGPYLSGGYGYHGERFAVKIIGNDRGIYRYLNSGISLEDDKQYAFRTNVNKYLTDALGELLLGKVQHPSSPRQLKLRA
ncbi:helix-turn-helix domain-containing protein [Chloroflexota bacterium]